MRNARVVIQSLRSMLRYKLRSAFMMIGSLVGVASLVLVVSVGTGVERKVLKTIEQLFSASSIFVTSGGNMMASGSRGDNSRLTLEDLEAIAADIPGVELWDPLQVKDNTQVRFGEAATTVRLVGQSERAERVWRRGLTQGEYFDTSAVAHSSRVALIGATAARALFGNADPLDAEIQIGGTPFRVIGTLEPMGTDAHGMDRDNEVVVPISTAMRRLLNVDTIRGAKLLMHEPSQVSEAAGEIARILRERHAIAPGQPDDFTIMTPRDVQRTLARGRQIVFVFLPLVAMVALLAGGIVAASLMLLSVNERIGEIGLRGAAGARPRDIALQFLSEAAVTTMLGGVSGILLGGLLSLLVARRLDLQSFFSWKAAIAGLLLSTVIGLAAGVLPARRAAALPPAEALR